MIHIVDYGMCNVGSIRNMLKRVGVAAVVSPDAEDLRRAERIILPGVGSFDAGMENLEQRGFVEVLDERVRGAGVPVLGICLGMQLLTRSSEEGRRAGLGWLAADTVRFDFSALDSRPRVPHMGWNTIDPRREHELFAGLEAPPRFYFVHSYHVVCEDPTDVLATCRHGYEFTCVVGRSNVFGTQFHPEKSHRFGLRLLENFSRVSVQASAHPEQA